MNKLILLPALLIIGFSASSQVTTNNRNKPLDTIPKTVAPLKLITNKIPLGNIGFVAASNYDDRQADVKASGMVKAGFSEEQYDAAGNFKNSVFTAPVDGFYHFDGMVYLNVSNDNSSCRLELDITDKDNVPQSGGYPAYGRSFAGGDNDKSSIMTQISLNVYLKKGYKVGLQYSAVGFASGSFQNGYFSGYKIF